MVQWPEGGAATVVGVRIGLPIRPLDHSHSDDAAPPLVVQHAMATVGAAAVERGCHLKPHSFGSMWL